MDCMAPKKPDRGSSSLPGSTLEIQLNMDYLIQILLIGDTGVGKSSLIARYADGEFVQGLIGTAGVDHKEKNVEH